jgi:hypothetical protein
MKQLVGVLTWVKDHLLLPLLSVISITGAVILVILGFKSRSVGGLLGKLLDPKPEKDSNRPVEPGVPDSKGVTEVIPLPLEVEEGQIVNPETEESIPLPDGVEPDEVTEVVVVTPTITEVKVTDSSPIKVGDVEALLKKVSK